MGWYDDMAERQDEFGYDPDPPFRQDFTRRALPVHWVIKWRDRHRDNIALYRKNALYAREAGNRGDLTYFSRIMMAAYREMKMHEATLRRMGA